jgi:hypothetical protein
MEKAQKRPKWLKNENLYTSGAVVTNRFTGEQIELNALELSIYDITMGGSMMCEMGLSNDWDIVRKGLSWFRQYSAEAYMVLLD